MCTAGYMVSAVVDPGSKHFKPNGYYYNYYYTICMSPVTGLFFSVLLLNQR